MQNTCGLLGKGEFIGGKVLLECSYFTCFTQSSQSKRKVRELFPFEEFKKL